MIKKQDIAAPRTVQDMERRYKFGKTFAETMGLAKEASKAAEKAEETVESLDSESVFNLLTENGTKGGFFIGNGENGTVKGDIYINAEYIKAGTVSADVVKLKEAKGEEYWVEFDTLLAFVSDTADAMDVGTQKVFSVVFEDNVPTGTVNDTAVYPDGNLQTVSSNGTLTISVGRNGNGFKEGHAVLTIRGHIFQLCGESEGHDTDPMFWDEEWATLSGVDRIIEEGKYDIWTYRKWNNGRIELWTNSYEFTVTFTKSSIGVYYATESGIAVPLVKTIEFASGDCTKWHYVNWASVTCNDGLTLGIRYYGLNANGGGNTIPFSFYVIGTWK